MSRILIPLILLVSLLQLPVRANDSAVIGAGGRWKRQGSGKTSVRMVKESVLLTLDQINSYTVQADFEFKNLGPATTVKMGFPEDGFGDIDNKAFKTRSAFNDFETRVDGQKTAVTRLPAAIDEEEYTAFWVKSVSFKRGQTRKIQVKYRAPYGSIADPVNTSCSYDFTGGNWFGTVEQSVLTVRFARPGNYIFGPVDAPGKRRFQRSGSDFNFTWHNWQAEARFSLYFVKVPPDWLAWPDRDPRHETAIAITIPGRASAEIGYLPPAMFRDGHALVSASALTSYLKDNGQTASFKVTDQDLTISVGQKTTTFPRRAKATNNPFEIRFQDSEEYFVPVDQLNRDLGLKLRADLKAHHIKWTK